MTTPTLYTCPIEECPWNHVAEPLQIPEDATPDTLTQLGQQHTAEIERAMVTHFRSHDGVEWANQVARLHQILTERPQLLCLGCYVDRHNAQRAGEPLPPQQMVQLVVNGSGMCLTHVKLQDGPVLPDRSAGGIILPGGPIPPQNPQTN